ncbi:hypothetical protein C8R45DRAFT_1014774 [Mycena sanguinolenta]|nr:hypothetical protein C8R45DRAFT_1014774 [Mycena sanguinolenta]
MSHIHQQLTLETLPNDVLIEILRLVARSPMRETTPHPFPIVASRVNHHFRAVALTCPELWSTIRLSHHSRSWRWAPTFLSQSGSYPLDISISLERYRPGYRSTYARNAPIPLRRALAILGPQIARWRTFSLRCWKSQLEELGRFMERSPVAARLESAHISLVDYGYLFDWSWYTTSLPPLAHIFGSPNLQAIHTLDIGFGAGFHPRELRKMLCSPLSLRTLIMRTSPAAVKSVSGPIEAATITSLAISFSSDKFSDLTRVFSFPNLEYLEIMGGSLTVSNEHRTPGNIFPNLHTLRLEGIAFTPISLASIQFFSHGITSLELIRTTNNHHLLASCANKAWPTLDSLTLCPEVTDRWWLSQFLAMCVARNALSTLILPPSLSRFTLPRDMRKLEIRWPRDGFSRGLMDGISGGCDFYVDEHDMRIKDFCHVEQPKRPGCARACRYHDFVYEDTPCKYVVEEDTRQMDEAIAEAFKATGEVARAKGIGHRFKRKHQKRTAGRKKIPARRKGKRYDFAENFSLTSGA